MDKNTKPFRIDGQMPEYVITTSTLKGQVIFVVTNERVLDSLPGSVPCINVGIEKFVCTSNMPEDLRRQVDEFALAESKKNK